MALERFPALLHRRRVNLRLKPLAGSPLDAPLLYHAPALRKALSYLLDQLGLRLQLKALRPVFQML